MIGLVAATVGCEDKTQDVPPSTTEPDMTNKYQLPRGIEVPDLTGIHEAYSVRKSEKGFFVFTLNVSAENIFRVFLHLASKVKEPAFLLFETGVHEDVEKTLRKKDSDPFHKDVYYIDGLNWARAESIVKIYSELLVNDGEINFGYGTHKGYDEVYVGPYRVFEIYADDPGKYITLLNELGIAKEEKVKTVWGNFTRDSPGQRSALTDAPITIWKMIEQLKEKGLYRAERRED